MKRDFAEIHMDVFVCLCGARQLDPRTDENEAGECFWFWQCPKCHTGYLLCREYTDPEVADCFTVYPPDNWRDKLHHLARRLRFTFRQLTRGRWPRWESPF